MLVGAKMLLNGSIDELVELLEKYYEQFGNKLIKYIIRYLFGCVSMTSSQMNLMNNIIETILKHFKVPIKIQVSGNTCKRNWNLFLEYNKNLIVELNKKCDCYAFMIDETSSHNESIMLLIVNYMINNELVKKIVKLERFRDSTNSDNISKWIFDQIDEYKFDKQKIMGICTDGAASMIKVTKIIQSQLNSKLVLIHCLAHRLNLIIKHTIEEYSYKFIEVIVQWFSSSNVQYLFLNYIKDEEINKPPRNCPTRWMYYIDFINYILDNFHIIEKFFII